MSDPNDLNPCEYAHAQLSLAWVKLASDVGRHFLFGQVELFTGEQPSPGLESVRSEALPGDPSFRVFATRVPLSVARAIQWFEQFACKGIWVRPSDAGDLPPNPDHEVPCSRGAVEPPWPMLKLLVDDSILGIVPSGDGQPLVSSSFPNDDLSISWTPTQKAAANAFVIQKLGIDLSVDDALWQTAHLVAANPRIRRFDVRLETDASDRHDSGLLLRTVIRSDTSFDKLYLQVLEHRDTGWLLLFDGPLTAADQRVAISAVTIDEVQWSVREQNGRLLQFGGPATFIRSIRMAMRVVGARRTVHVPALRRRAEDTFTVDASGSPQLSVIGEERPQDGAALMRGIRRRVAMKRAADALEQMWFDGGADEAAPTIRRLVSRVQTRAMFIDPYVGPMEMARFVSAIPNHSAKIQVLGSMEGIRSGKTSAPEGGVLIALNALEDRTVELKDKLTMRNLEVRLMKGKRADVHDRFIVCDDQVWTLGSSLNEFGSRGTMLLRVPHPELILQRLDRAWSKAVATTEKIKLYQAALSEGKERPDNEDDDADDAAVDIAEKP